MSARSFLALTATVAVVTACGESPTQVLDSGPVFARTAGNPVVASATGSGHAPCADIPFRCDPANPDGGFRTFSFNAQLHADGSVRGRMQVKNRENGNHGQGDIVCIRFTRDNRAWMIAEITHALSGGAVGALAAFGVEDNGEGNAAVADRMTNLFPANTAALVCDGNEVGDAILNGIFENPILNYDLVDGNIQVRGF